MLWRICNFQCKNAIAIVLMFLSLSLAYDPVIGAVVKKHAHPQPKIDPVKALILMKDVNRYHSSEDLSAACRRSNFQGLAYALSLNESWLKTEKREFETSDEFSQRAEKLTSLIGGDQILVCQPLNDNEDAPFEYKADIQKFSGAVHSAQNIWRDRKQLGRFKTRTRMGIPFTISASSVMEFDADFEINANRRGCLNSEKYNVIRNYEVSVPRSDAPYLKATGYLVYIGRLTSPYVETSSSHDTASLDDPFEVVRNGITLHLAVDRLIVADGHGKEWWNCNPLEGPGALPPQPIGDPTLWLTPSDFSRYSPNALANGDLEFVLSVSRYGTVTGCNLSTSSGDASLDRLVCLSVQIRAKFIPAIDRLGEDVEGTYKMTVNPRQ